MIDEQDPSGKTLYWIVGLLNISQEGELKIEEDNPLLP